MRHCIGQRLTPAAANRGCAVVVARHACELGGIQVSEESSATLALSRQHPLQTRGALAELAAASVHERQQLH